MTRRILQYLLVGSLLVAGQAVYDRVASPRVVALRVEVAAGASAHEVERVIEEEILVDHTLRMGWHENDRVIRGHLTSVMKFALDGELGNGPRRLLHEAERLGMLRQDLVARARILQKARFILSSLDAADTPSESQLAQYAAAHSGRYRRAGDLRFAHVHVSRARSGDALDRASRLLVRLRRDDPEPAEAFRMGDPLLRARPLESRSIPSLREHYGEAFAGQVLGAPTGAWSGPFESSFGAHLVKVIERRADRTGSFAEVRNRALGDYLKEARRDRFRQRFERLRERYRVDVIRSEAGSV